MAVGKMGDRSRDVGGVQARELLDRGIVRLLDLDEETQNLEPGWSEERAVESPVAHRGLLNIRATSKPNSTIGAAGAR
ncbi:hypothetical protein ACFFX0_22020 [Citricoccus parietis]|uniref:Uncharacterized protein n=1 Tax=Citricoccus parietis TaxID=592307 RepID=A0ABV5G479_9MICC